MKRKKMSKRSSKKVFANGVKKVKTINLSAAPMRGGIRL